MANGGARPGAGRPKGSVNKLPSRAGILNERLSEKVEANFEALSDELLRLALHARLESDRIKALTMLFDRALGKTPDVVVVEDATEKTAEDLLAAWRETKQ